MKVADVAWLAGLLEGEGSFVVRPKNTPYISLKMNDKDVVEKAGAMMNVSVSKKQNNYKTSFGVDVCWNIQVYSRNVILELIPRMMPYFGGRRQGQAQKLYDVCARRKNVEADYLQNIELIRELHNRGVSRRELAEMTGRARNTIGNWIRGPLPEVQIPGYDWGR